MNDPLPLAWRLLDQPQGMVLAHPPSQRESFDLDEIIEGGDEITYILHAPGFEENQLQVLVSGDQIEVEAPDFVRRRRLPFEVNQSSVVKEYRKGVMSVRVKKA